MAWDQYWRVDETLKWDFIQLVFALPNTVIYVAQPCLAHNAYFYCQVTLISHIWYKTVGIGNSKVWHKNERTERRTDRRKVIQILRWLRDAWVFSIQQKQSRSHVCVSHGTVLQGGCKSKNQGLQILIKYTFLCSKWRITLEKGKNWSLCIFEFAYLIDTFLSFTSKIGSKHWNSNNAIFK